MRREEFVNTFDNDVVKGLKKLKGENEMKNEIKNKLSVRIKDILVNKMFNIKLEELDIDRDYYMFDVLDVNVCAEKGYPVTYSWLSDFFKNTKELGKRKNDFYEKSAKIKIDKEYFNFQNDLLKHITSDSFLNIIMEENFGEKDNPLIITTQEVNDIVNGLLYSKAYDITLEKLGGSQDLPSFERWKLLYESDVKVGDAKKEEAYIEFKNEIIECFKNKELVEEIKSFYDSIWVESDKEIIKYFNVFNEFIETYKH